MPYNRITEHKKNEYNEKAAKPGKLSSQQGQGQQVIGPILETRGGDSKPLFSIHGQIGLHITGNQQREEVIFLTNLCSAFWS